MQVHHWWWILALALSVGEMLTATFYLLVLAAGAAAGGLVAWFGGSITQQVLITAAVAFGGWVWLWRRKPPRGEKSVQEGDRNMQLDVGERIRVERWTDGRSSRVLYRGAQWSVELDSAEPDTSATEGFFVIARIDGSRLIVRRAA